MQNLKFLALVVVKIYAVTLSIGFSRRFSPKSGFWGIKRGLLTLGTCPPKGVFTITFLTHVPNFRKIGQKLWSLSWTKRFADTHTRTNTQVILYLSNAMNCIGQTKNNLVVFNKHASITQSTFRNKPHLLHFLDFV